MALDSLLILPLALQPLLLLLLLLPLPLDSLLLLLLFPLPLDSLLVLPLALQPLLLLTLPLDSLLLFLSITPGDPLLFDGTRSLVSAILGPHGSTFSPVDFRPGSGFHPPLPPFPCTL
ncbi:MAG: hypothetical protein HPY84_16870, partial [Syntrophobacteraceae bacterium]|nr:hypothetical protein [Syntrophobacteraceae bacterium]